MTRRDRAEVLAFDPAWAPGHLADCLARRTCIGLVADLRRPPEYHVVGYMVYELCRHSVMLLRIATRPEHRHGGVGKALLKKVVRRLPAHRRPFVACHVAEEDLDAHLFLRACGFHCVGIVGQCYRFVRWEEGAAPSEPGEPGPWRG
jgi:ribosomal protein S18 acetylase RimI-like enzyme